MSRGAPPAARAALLLVALALGACASSGAHVVGGVRVDVAFDAPVAGWTDADLRARAEDELTRFGEARRRPADAADAAYAMERALRDDGHAEARVEFRLEPDEEAPERLVFEVHAGPRTLLGDVSFPGAERYARSALARLVRRGSGLPFSGAQPYRRADVDAAVAEVETLYRLAGHARVRVGPPEITFAEDRTRADVVIPVKEGRLFRVARIELEGELDDALRAELRAALPAPGAPYHARVASEAAARARAWLLEHGRRRAEVSATSDVDRENGVATVRVHVSAGPVVHTGDVALSGTERTDAAFARERVALQPGDVVAQSALDDAVDQLYRTGAFRVVRLDVTPRADAADAERPVDDVALAVEEADARSVEVGAGWGSYELLRSWVRYRDRNFTGRARVLDLDAHASLRSAGVGARAGDRYLLGRDRTLSAGARYEFREQPSFDSRTLDLDVSVRHDLSRQDAVTYGYRLRFDEARHRESAVRGAEEDGFSRAAGLFADVEHDTRDDRLFPTRGVFAQFGLFRSAPDLGGDLDFLEWRAAWSRCFPLREGTVLAVGGRFVTRDVFSGGPSLPIQERLFLGGESTVRSFREDELGPVDAERDPRGGLTSAVANVELRQQLWGRLDGALFFDVGTVSPKSFDLSEPVGEAVGAGLRYRLPVGPVRLDVGYNPAHRFAARGRVAIHLSFGFSF